jgi:predicted DsbA family dithiol-disulfide isomerase
MPVRIDVFYAAHCGGCRRVIPRLKQLVAGRDDVVLREMDILEHLDAAVAAGVRVTPTLVVRGRARLSGNIGKAAFLDLLEKLTDERS